MSSRRRLFIFALSAVWFAVVPSLWANPILDPGGPGGLSLFNVSNLDAFNAANPTGLFEGVAINGNSLYLSLGDPTSLTQTVWQMPLIRNSSGHITSVNGNSAVLYKSLPNDGFYGDVLGGGLITVNGGILYTMLQTYLGQAVGTPSLTDLGTTQSIGGLQYIPASQNALGNAGKLKVSTTNGDWYTVNISGTAGSYTVGTVTQASIGVQAYSFDYLPVDATFAYPSVILGDAYSISIYKLDGNGNPLPATQLNLVDAVDAAVGYGVVRDPVTGDVLFTTGDNQIYRLSDTFDVPEPSTLLLALAGIALLAVGRVGQTIVFRRQSTFRTD